LNDKKSNEISISTEKEEPDYQTEPNQIDNRGLQQHNEREVGGYVENTTA